jgi:hypothetical protein
MSVDWRVYSDKNNYERTTLNGSASNYESIYRVLQIQNNYFRNTFFTFFTLFLITLIINIYNIVKLFFGPIVYKLRFLCLLARR